MFLSTITITVIYGEKTQFITTYPNEYRNLMMLIYDNLYVEEFGECLGMGKCGTCLIEIVENKGELTSFDRNEETTIGKSCFTHKNVRLSCQILIDEHLNGLKIKVCEIK